MKEGFRKVSELIDSDRGEMASTLAKMIGIKAISPASGGTGEAKRADFLQGLLRRWGFRVRRYDYLDNTGTRRSNLVARFGEGKRTLWVIAHIDTVSEGDRSLWKTDPFKGVIKNGKVYGRGSADDGNAVVASMFALRALKESAARLKYNYGLVLAADEENGSKYGIEKLLKERIFGKNDMVLVPDFGNERGDAIEVGEKSILQLRVTVYGKQVHASTPEMGVNAYRYSTKFLSILDTYLHKKYSAIDRSFIDGSASTFEMTKHEKNLDSPNIVPGIDVFYLDFRVLPRYSLDSVLNDVRKVAKRKELGKAKIEIEIVQKKDSLKPTGERSTIIKLLKEALKELRGVKARCIGIGGGTVAYFFREIGMPAAVWNTEYDIAHTPNEYAMIKFMVEDAKVFAYLCI